MEFYVKRPWAVPSPMAKILRVMKLTVILITAAIMQVSAAGFAQNLTLKTKNANLKEVFSEIKKQTGLNVLYRSSDIRDAKLVNINVNAMPIEQAMALILRDQSLDFGISDKNIVIRPKEEKGLIEKIKDYFAQIEVTGKVIDENGAPLSGASVVLKSNGKGTSTSVDGSFTMREIEEGVTLVVKYMGYDPKEVKAEKNLGIIRLELAKNSLNEVQVQAYTQTSKRLSVSSIASVKSKDIENQVVNNPLSALQGRVPGLQITQMSGNAGSSFTVRIQGVNSLRAGLAPFYVVDGIPYSSSTIFSAGNMSSWGYPQGRAGTENSSLQLEGSGSPLSYINPEDIESIDVLKDADATAIYGSRAANGAIVITTKKGKPGIVKVDFNVRSGWETVPHSLNFLNTEQYLEIRREAYRNSNAVIPANAYDLNGTYDQTRYTDWQKELFKSQNRNTASLGISGGSINSNYRINLTTNWQGSPYGDDFKNKDIALSTSINTTSANQKFKLGLMANFLNNVNTLPNSGGIIGDASIIGYLVPNAPALYNLDGSVNWALDINGNSTWTNHPFRSLINPFEVKTNNLSGSLNLGYNILNGLDFKVNLGYNRLSQEEFSSFLLSSVAPANRLTSVRSGSFKFVSSESYSIEPLVNFSRQFSLHKINALLGGSYQLSQSGIKGVQGSGQTDDSQVRNLAAASSIVPLGVYDSENRFIALFARLEYSNRDKYILTGTVRRDGSSRFGTSNRFANFWSLGAGWIISEERWLKGQSNWLNFLKLRGNYGVTGNDQVGPYSFMDLFAPINYGVPYQGVVGQATTQLFTPDLQWEENRKLNFGLDINIFSKVDIGVNYFRNRSSNQLQNRALPATAGFNSILKNFEALIENSGWEFTLGTNFFKNGPVNWNINANLSLGPINKLLKLDDQSLIPSAFAAGYIIGEPLGSTRRTVYSGVNPMTGLETIEDINGNPVSEGGGNQFKLDNPFNEKTSYSGGIQNSISYHGLRLDIFFRFVNQLKQRYLFTGPQTLPGRTMVNQPAVVYDLNRWRNPGDVAVFQRYSTAAPAGGKLYNTREYYEDASFIRLQNIALSWNLPTKWCKTISMRNSSVGLNVQNLWTLSKYSGIDPETGSTTMPPIRSILLKVTAGF